MKTFRILEILQWLGRACLLAYMALSIVVILYLSAQNSSTFLTDALSPNLRHDPLESSDGEVENSFHATNEKTFFPDPQNNEYFDLMKKKGVERSIEHQKKFLARKAKLEAEFEPKIRFQSPLDHYAAIIISKTFAFLHVWKCGGTTVASLTGDVQLELQNEEVQKREWVAFVRDPIDRFLSAWAECGFRNHEGSLALEDYEEHTVLNWLDGDYDFRLRAFLHEVRDFTFPEPFMSCHIHAHPQANFMMNENRQLDPHVTIVGDLSELRPVLEIANFEDFSDHVKGRDASANEIKARYFPSNRSEIKNQTLLELCEFYAMDYFLFDFKPPGACIQEGAPLARYQ